MALQEYSVKTIAWDVDDVLNDLMRCWFENQWLPYHPDCHKRYEDLKENPPHMILGIGLEDYLKSLDEFRLSDQYNSMQPVHEVMEWFQINGESYRHIALTSVPLKAAFMSAQWVLRNFGKWIRTFHFVPSKRADEVLPEYDKDKGDFLKWLGKADIFIDDNMANARNAEESGVRCVLVPKPWNNQNDTYEGVLGSLTAL
jgi:5'(3')-deoxyribonucleotidase